MGWESGSDARTGPCLDFSDQVKVRWRSLNPRQFRGYENDSRINLGETAPNAIRIYSFEPTRASQGNQHQIALLNEYIQGSTDNKAHTATGYRDFKVFLGSEITNAHPEDTKRMKISVYPYTNQSNIQVLIQDRKSGMHPQVWQAKVTKLDTTSHNAISRARYMTNEEYLMDKDSLYGDVGLNLNRIDRAFRAGSRNMKAERRTQFLSPKGGSSVDTDEIFNMRVTEENSRSQTFDASGGGDTQKIVDYQDDDKFLDLTQPTLESTVNLSWSRMIPEDARLLRRMVTVPVYEAPWGIVPTYGALEDNNTRSFVEVDEDE
ncbi:uncharacterized protein L199_003640 [Kwoniella botswanensis]|uniref:uncharacterized protein n=1 Tax=Kwoniella botswanensis TaxID=1268659 RepID=UPI00315D693B